MPPILQGPPSCAAIGIVVGSLSAPLFSLLSLSLLLSLLLVSTLS
jgi:hypothetical protein